LTKLYNRRFFDLVFEQIIKRQKLANGTMTFFMLDIDNFKKYNDAYGHQMGDHVLATVGQIMLETISTDTAHPIRIGGEEFGGVMAGLSKQDSVELANKLRIKIQEQNIEHKTNDNKGVVTASFGLIFLDFSNEIYKNMSPKDIYLKADKALYKAKENGRNRLVFWPEN
jgi:diguanylate cyclase (GGDEF)-like protein